jgi:hypothetical protein
MSLAVEARRERRHVPDARTATEAQFVASRSPPGNPDRRPLAGRRPKTMGGRQERLESCQGEPAAEHAGRLMFLNVEPRFDSVRSERGYAELVRLLGFRS